MTASRFLFTVFPTTEMQALQWWLVDGGALKAKGCDVDPMLAAGLKRSSDEGGMSDSDQNEDGQAEEDGLTTIALMPSVHGVVRWHERIDDLTDQQQLAAARLAARQHSLDRENIHIAAVLDGSGQAVTAVAGRDVMASGLLKLNALGIDPDVIVPAGWLIAPPEDTLVEADFGFEKLLRGSQVIAPDEPDLRALVIGDSAVTVLSAEAVDGILASVAVDGAASLSLNLRRGDFAKKVRRAITDRQKRILGWLAAALVVITLLIPVIHLAKYHSAASAADAAGLAAAKPIVGEVDSAEEANRLLSEQLIQKNRGYVAFPVPASALFSALQQAPGVSIEKIGYRRDGTVSAGLSAVRAEDINTALIAVQKAGFVITATPRTDATGATKADITVRAP
ncbi:hypothetical protein [Parasphingorhabdus sp.]|uniref:hypothetical protein n=1 Tax=Parasphingorhabdus sp. TaxID=2709688 RepID=UPI002F91F448